MNVCMHKYIDKNTFEILDNVFEVDELIASSISLLNKKGYHTLFSCGGHVKDPRIYEKYNIAKDDVIEDYAYKIDNNNVLEPYSFTSIYIKFNKKYFFENLPENFELLDDNILEKIIYYYDNNIKRESKEIDNEIIKYNNILYTWCEKLPYIY